jgi:hypothetical protein
MKKPIILNFLGGPGSGKSTLASRVFTEMKEMRLNVELNTEFAKDLTWEKSFGVLSNQLYVFAKQQHRIFRVANEVDFIVTDSPLILSLIYGEMYIPDMSQTFKDLIVEEYTKYPRFDVMMERVHEYQELGRNQDLEKAKEIDRQIGDIYHKQGWEFDLMIHGHKEAGQKIIKKLFEKFQL